MPAIVSLALAFGLILVGAVYQGGIQNTQSCTPEMLKSSGGCEIGRLMGSSENTITRKAIPNPNNANEWTSVTEVKVAGMVFKYHGKAINPTEGADNASSASGILSATGNVFGTIIIDIIALSFIWIAFMAAKNVSKTVEIAISPFEKIGSSIAEMSKKLPGLVPLPSQLGGSIGGL